MSRTAISVVGAAVALDAGHSSNSARTLADSGDYISRLFSSYLRMGWHSKGLSGILIGK